MPEQKAVTVEDLLPARVQGIDEVIATELAKDGNTSLPVFALKLLGSEANDALRGALNIDVCELLARGWCAARELHKFTDCAKHPRGERSIVFLGEHSLTCKVHPVITISLGPTQFPPLRMTLELRANFRTAALTIQDGYITALSDGDCSVSTLLKYGEVKLHDELKSRNLTFPGKLKFEAPGLAIH
jgi:hypothetical protein